MIEEVVRTRLDKFSVNNVIITGDDCGATYGYAELQNGFRVGFVFFLPNHVSLTMSQEDLITNLKRYEEAH